MREYIRSYIVFCSKQEEIGKCEDTCPAPPVVGFRGFTPDGSLTLCDRAAPDARRVTGPFHASFQSCRSPALAKAIANLSDAACVPDIPALASKISTITIILFRTRHDPSVGIPVAEVRGFVVSLAKVGHRVFSFDRNSATRRPATCSGINRGA